MVSKMPIFHIGFKAKIAFYMSDCMVTCIFFRESTSL